MKLFLSLITLFSVSLISAQQYKPVNDKSDVKFTIKNFGINTNGSFSGLKGTISFDPSKLSAASFNVTLDAPSINTGIDMRDKHLKEEEYFNVEKYSTISFVSTALKLIDNGYTMNGTLTIKGVSKNISFPFTSIQQNDGMLFTGSFNINRKDFNVGGSSAVLGNNVDISLKVFAQKNNN